MNINYTIRFLVVSGLPLCRRVVPWEIIHVDRRVPRKSAIVSHHYREFPRVNYQIHSKQLQAIASTARRETAPKSA